MEIKQGTIRTKVQTVIGDKELLVHYTIKTDGEDGTGDIEVEMEDGSQPPLLSDDTVAEIIAECIKDSNKQEFKVFNNFDFSKN